MSTVVIGTAGHIDHGKTALLRTLTGIDADRLPEEKARGMTIDVGFAHLAFEDGVELDFVDVPGHDRLIGNMLVGAGEIDAAMLVVAADDGPRPQTVEHLQLLDALGIADGLAVVTKADLVDPGRLATVVAEVERLLAATSLAGAAVLPAASTTGEGIDRVRAGLRVVRDRVAERWASSGGHGDPDLGSGPRGQGRSDLGEPRRLAVDRAFSVHGRGMVVTGTLRRGTVAAGDVLRVEPGGATVRVRGVQVHGESRDRSDGGRTALNVVGEEADDLRRGVVLTDDPRLRATDRLLVGIPEGAATEGWPTRTGTLRLHLGTAQADARLRRIMGAARMAMLDLSEPVATFAGDVAVLREPGRGRVVAGVRVLDLEPPRGISRRRMTSDRLAALAGAAAAGDPSVLGGALVRLHGALARERADGSGARSLDLADDVAASLSEAALEVVAAHHRDAPLSAGLPLPRARAALLRRLRSLATVERRDSDAAAEAVARLLDRLVDSGLLARRGDSLRDPGRPGELPAALLAAMDRLEAALAVAAPPSLEQAAAEAGCPPEGIRALQADGRIVRIGPDLAWAAATFHHLAAVALEAARAAPLTPAALRDATGTSRKYVLAILEDLDRRGILQRTPHGHIPGPKAPRIEAGAGAGAGGGR